MAGPKWISHNEVQLSVFQSRVTHEHRTYELSTTPEKADTIRRELHRVAASRGRFYRKINASQGCEMPRGSRIQAGVSLVYQVV